MFTGLIIFIILGAIFGFIVKGKDGVANGAIGGFASFIGIVTTFGIPILIMLLLFKACF